MGSVDDRTFRVNFSDDGVANLRERVTDKLKEFMGDYTDDTLVEYVIVLLRNGRRKEEARNELNVFLGDDSESFVSWLWDHLSSNLNLYVHPEDSHLNETSKIKPALGEQAGGDDSSHMDLESERGKSNKLSRSRHNREWKGLVRDAAEPPPLRRSEVEYIHFEEKKHEVSHARKSPSPPRSTFQKKRSRPDDRHHTKREVSQSTIDAPRRLLQFAVRDAVGTTKPSNSGKEPSLKRLRSVVSTATGGPESVGHTRRIRSVAMVPNPLATVIKAVAEATEDVRRVKSAGSVFDRLGRGMDASDMGGRPEFRQPAVEDEEYGSFSRISEQTGPSYLERREYSGQYDGNSTMLDSETGLAFDSLSDDEEYGAVNVTGRRVINVDQSGLSGGNRVEDSLMLPYNVVKNADEEMQLAGIKDQNLPVTAINAPRKMVNISVNVNSKKPHQESREVPESDGRKSILENDARHGKTGVQLMKENSNPVTVGNGNAKPAADTQKEPQKVLPSAPGLYTVGRPQEDADSRTIFVSNVHFAATKDSLSRHFNKFGEVLKVVIVTDAATGQPKGSAYVEFMRKEAADNALSLDGTSFMSRILKVVKRSAAHQESTPLITWPRARGSPYTAVRFTRAPFSRSIPGGFRPHLPIKPGARSLQWKRDAQATPAETGAQVPLNSVPSPTARSLTYVRQEPKLDGSSR
ncbi:putative RNA binding family protein [Melia azedarach]|nr:putative RNA binding family protein [Melia azedarach]